MKMEIPASTGGLQSKLSEGKEIKSGKCQVTLKCPVSGNPVLLLCIEMMILKTFMTATHECNIRYSENTQIIQFYHSLPYRFSNKIVREP